MNVSFVNDPLNTVVVNTANRNPLYEVNTPWKAAGRTTTIQRAGSSGKRQMVAQLEWHGLSHSKITFMGSKMRMDDFLPKAGYLTTSTLLKTGDGRTYKWEQNWGGTLQLVDCTTKEVVAASHKKTWGIFSKSREMNLDIQPQVMNNIDAVVVSFIIMENKHRQRDTGTAASNAAIIGAT